MSGVGLSLYLSSVRFKHLSIEMDFGCKAELG
jgi:hypothetical protein